MKVKRMINGLFIFMLVLGLVTGTVAAVSLYNLDTDGIFSVNENGQTYGYFVPAETPEEQQMPQLIAAIGVDGTIGYVNLEDLEKDLPQNPQEAVEYMCKMEEASSIAAIDDLEYFSYVPLYAEDGTTAIGQFGIGHIEELDVIIAETE